jgi:hypothetical protein
MTRVKMAEVITLPRIFDGAIESGMTQPKKKTPEPSLEQVPAGPTIH